MLQGRIRHSSAPALLFALSLIAAFSHLAYAPNSDLACPINPVPSFMDVIIDPPVGPGSIVSVLVYNISDNDYIKNGIQGGLVILINQSNKTNIQLLYDITNSEGWSQFTYNSDAEGCTDYWFIFCPLTDAVNSVEARQMCLNGTKIPQSIITGGITPANTAPPTPAGHGCSSKTTQSACENACSTTASNLAPAEGQKPAPPAALSQPAWQTAPQPAALAAPLPSQKDETPLTAAGFFVPTGGDTLCQYQSWMYSICNPGSSYRNRPCTYSSSALCSADPGCKWDISYDGNPANDKCVSWDYLCDGCIAAQASPSYCGSVTERSLCNEQDKPGCDWDSSSNSCKMWFGCPGSSGYGGAALCGSLGTCCSDGMCRWICTASAPQLPTQINIRCSSCANACYSTSNCRWPCPYGQQPTSGGICCLSTEHYCSSTRTCSVNNVCCNNGESRCPDGVCRTSCCGGTGLPCCTTGTPCVAGNACNPATQMCQACGAAGQPCCEGSTCGSGLSCDMSQNPPVCYACGGISQPCCTTGTPCIAYNYTTCNATSQKCQACGAAGQLCCSGICTGTGLSCNTSAAIPTCFACGGAGMPCCTTGTTVCSANLSCQSGICATSLPCASGEHICTTTGLCSVGGACCNAGQTLCPDGSCKSQHCAWNSLAHACVERVAAGTPGYPVPLNANTSYYLPSLNQFYICNKKPSTYAGLCWPVMLILGLLIGASFLAGRNPFTAFDLSAPRMSRGKQYTMRNQNKSFDITSAVMIGANKMAETASGGEQGLVSQAIGSVVKGTVGKAADFVFGASSNKEVSDKGKGKIEAVKGKDDPDGPSGKPGQVQRTGMVAGTTTALASQTAPDLKTVFGFGADSLFGKIKGKIGDLGSLGSLSEKSFDKGSLASAMFKDGSGPSAGKVLSALMNHLSGQVSQLYSKVTGILGGMFNFSKREESDGKGGLWEKTKDGGAFMTRFLTGVLDLYAVFKDMNDTVRQYKGIAKGLNISDMSTKESMSGIGLIDKFESGSSGVSIFGRQMGAGEMVRMLNADPTMYGGMLSMLQPSAQMLRDRAEWDSRTEADIGLSGKKVMTSLGKFTITSGKLVFDDYGNEITGEKKEKVLKNESVKLVLRAMGGDDSAGAKAEDVFLKVNKKGAATETDFIGYRRALMNQARLEGLRGRVAKDQLDVQAAGFMRVDKVLVPLLAIPESLATLSPSKLKQLKKMRDYEKSDELKEAELFVKLTKSNTVDEKSKKLILGLKEAFENGTLSGEDAKKIKGIMGAERDPVDILDKLSRLENSDISKMQEFRGYSGITGAQQLDLYSIYNSSVQRVNILNSSLQVMSSKGSLDEKDRGRLMRNEDAYLLNLRADEQKTQMLQNIMSNDRGGMMNYVTETMKKSKAENEAALKTNEEAIADHRKQGLSTQALEFENSLLKSAIGAPKSEREAFVQVNDAFILYQQTRLADVEYQTKWINAAWESGVDMRRMSEQISSSLGGQVDAKGANLFETMDKQMDLSQRRASAFNDATNSILQAKSVIDGIEKNASLRREYSREGSELNKQVKEVLAQRDKLNDLAADRVDAVVKGAKDAAILANKHELGSEEFTVKYGRVGTALERNDIETARNLLKQADGNLSLNGKEIDLGKVDMGDRFDVGKNRLALTILEGKQTVDTIGRTNYEGSPIDDGTLQKNAKATADYMDRRAEEFAADKLTPGKLNEALEVLGGKSGFVSRLDDQEVRTFRSSSEGVQIVMDTLGKDWVARTGILGQDYMEDAYSNLMDQARGATESHKVYSIFEKPGGYEWGTELFNLPMEKIDYAPPEIKPIEMPRAEMPGIKMPGGDAEDKHRPIYIFHQLTKENPYGSQSIAAYIPDAKPTNEWETKKDLNANLQMDHVLHTIEMLQNRQIIDVQSAEKLRDAMKVDHERGQVYIDAHAGLDQNMIKTFSVVTQLSAARTPELTEKAVEQFAKQHGLDSEDMSTEQKAETFVNEAHNLVDAMATIKVKRHKDDSGVYLSNSNKEYLNDFIDSSFANVDSQSGVGEAQAGKKKK